MSRDPEKRILLIGTCSSGSTAISKCFLQRPDTEVLSQIMKTAVEKGLSPDHDAFYNARTEKNVLFNKEVFGWKNLMLSTFSVIPDPKININNLVAIILFRNPVYVWNGRKKRGWDLSLDLFFAAYEHLYETMNKFRDLAPTRIRVVIFDKMSENPEKQLREICDFSSIPFNPQMLNWEMPWGNRRGGNTGNPDIDKYCTFDSSRVLPKLNYSMDEQRTIEHRLGKIWVEVT